MLSDKKWRLQIDGGKRPSFRLES